MEWFKKHADTVVVLSAIVSSIAWMNGRFSQIDKEILMIKTVLLVKGIYPSELAINNQKGKLDIKKEK